MLFLVFFVYRYLLLHLPKIGSSLEHSQAPIIIIPSAAKYVYGGTERKISRERNEPINGDTA